MPYHADMMHPAAYGPPCAGYEPSSSALAGMLGCAWVHACAGGVRFGGTYGPTVMGGARVHACAGGARAGAAESWRLWPLRPLRGAGDGPDRFGGLLEFRSGGVHRIVLPVWRLACRCAFRSTLLSLDLIKPCARWDPRHAIAPSYPPTLNVPLFLSRYESLCAMVEVIPSRYGTDTASYPAVEPVCLVNAGMPPLSATAS